MSLNSGSTIPFTIATLQQCTNSFSEENFIGEGLLGSVYVAELPDGKVEIHLIHYRIISGNTIFDSLLDLVLMFGCILAFDLFCL